MNSDKTTSIESIMTALPLETAIPSRTIFDIANQMKKKNKAAIIIVENMVGSSSNSSNTSSSSFDSASADSNSSNRNSMLAKPLGIITERDIVRRIVSEEKDPKKTQASEIMSKPVISVGSEASIYDASLIMTKYNIRRLPIVRDNILLGIVTATDLSRHIYERNKEDPTLKAMSRFISLEKQL